MSTAVRVAGALIVGGLLGPAHLPADEALHYDIHAEGRRVGSIRVEMSLDGGLDRTRSVTRIELKRL